MLRLQAALAGREWLTSSFVTGPLRAVKDDAEIEALAAASAGADRVAAQLLAGEIPLVGRTEREVSQDIGRRLVERGPSEGQLRHRRQRPQLRPAPTTTPAAG